MNLRSLVAQHALNTPGELACIYLRDGETEDGRLAFGQLHDGAIARARWLRELAGERDRALLAYPAGLEFLVAFLGCVYAGLIPVPVELPGRGAAGAEKARRMRGIAEDCGARLLLTSSTAQAYLPEMRMEWRFSNRAPEFEARSGEFAECGQSLDEVVYLQYTSGSTGEPKAVPVTGRSLEAQFEYHRMRGVQRGVSMFGSWLPHFHDFGLVGFHLSALAMGLPHVFMAPGAFLAGPKRWLKMISRYRVGYSGAPNFAYGLCARSRGSDELDLSCWRIASVGGEEVVPETLRAFARQFAAARFDSGAYLPAYGLAEAGLCVAARQGVSTEWFCRESLSRGLVRRTEAGAGVELVGYGQPVAGLGVEVDGVGELVVRRDESENVRTGDLGFFYEGNLYIAGRLKDVLIVRGRNLDPCDLERTAEGIDARLRPAGTAVVQDADEVVVLQEVDRSLPASDMGMICARIARSIVARHGVAVGTVVLLRGGGLPRTSSGKIRRGECRRRLAAGGFAEVFRWRGQGAQVRIEAREYWMRTLGYQAPRMLVSKGPARLKEPSGKMWRASLAHQAPVDVDAALTAMFVLLHRWTGLTRLMVGLVSAGRVAPVLVDIADRAGDEDLAQAVRRQRLAASEYADYTLAMLAGELRRASNAASSSGLGATLSFDEESAEGDELSVPLAVRVADRGVRLAFQVEVFSEPDAARLASYYTKLLDGMSKRGGVHPLDLPMLAVEEDAQLQEWSQGGAEEDLLGIGEFEAWAAREPDRTAVVHRGESLSYGRLTRWADGIAGRLRGTAGVLSRRGFGLVAGLVAGLKAGASCVGLDPEQPALELRGRLQRAGVVVLCYAKEFEQLARTVCVGLQCELVCLEEEVKERGRFSGRPLGEIARRVRTLELTDADVVAQTARPGSPEALWQCTSALLVGGRIAVIEAECASGLLARWARDEVTVAEEPAHLVREVLEVSGFTPETFVPLPKLRWMVAADEPFAADLCRRWIACYPHSRMLHGLIVDNGCGLEQVIEWPPSPGDFRVALGRPVAGTELELRDARGNAVPPGAPGYIWLNGLATGRRGRFLPDGRVEEAGPAVTVDGWPFDVAEVEAALRRSPAVRDAAVMVLGEGAAEAVLLAFVVLRKQPMTSAGMLRALLRKSLPSSMVPSAVRFVERLPRTTAGSVDWDALPMEKLETRLGTLKGPETKTEKRISAIWHLVLTARPIGVEDDLFELGGDSLTAARIAAEIGSAFKLRMPVSELFRASTVRGVSRHVDEQISMNPALDQAVDRQLTCNEASYVTRDGFLR